MSLLQFYCFFLDLRMKKAAIKPTIPTPIRTMLICSPVLGNFPFFLVEVVVELDVLVDADEELVVGFVTALVVVVPAPVVAPVVVLVLALVVVVV